MLYLVCRLLLDLFGGILGLHGQRLHFGGDHRKAAAGDARPRSLDGGVQRQQRGLLCDLRDQVDDIADGGRGFAQAIDIDAGFARGGAGLVGEDFATEIGRASCRERVSCCV